MSCGISTDLGQCQINCEMTTYSGCVVQADVDCLLAAACAADCDALAKCGFVL